jgi:parallel beta-helix repeat protein
MVYGSNVLSYFIHDIDTSNLVNGKPIYYLINQQNLTIDPNAYQNIGYLALVNCTHMIVENLTLQGNSEGLLVAYTGDTRIVNNYITNSLYGILGIDLYGNTLSGNNITGNLVGISITGWWNTLFNNNITNNTSPEFGGVGVLFNTFSEDNAMVGNDIGSNGVGVYLFSSDNNTFYHNNFVNNTEQAVSTDELGPPPNDWNEEYPWGGNYWSNYNGTDLHRGPFQNETGPDGIGDTYYPMNQNNSDRYPLMKPWTMPEHDLHLSDVYIERSVSYYLPTTHVYAGQIVGIVTLLRNEGKATETFNVTCDCDGSMISTLSVSNFTSGDFRFLEFTWNTTGLAPCRNHTISAEAEPVAEETMPGNNKMTMLVEVNLMGDINGDGSVNIIDIARIAKSFGKPAYYDPDCDLNLDDEINIVDIAMAARYFGRTCG